MRELGLLLVALLVYALTIGVMERWAPAREVHRGPRDARADLAWFFVDDGVRQAARWLILTTASVLLGVGASRVGYDGHGPLSRLPMIVQGALAILIVDVMGYAVHRVTHAVPWLWRVHAIHHLPRHLDWLAGNRVHPLDTWITRPFRVLPALLLGLHPLASLATAPFFAFWNLFVHANVPWRFGPLRYVVSTPAFHRWHHAADARPCNFAPLLPLWDLMFGTFHLPDALPDATGVDGLDVADDDFVGQVVAPFRGELWR